jgi:uncharacterized protein (DUF362 family)
MSTVCIKKADSPYASALERLLEPFAATLALRGASILIKPNLVEPELYTTGQTTNPALVEAIVIWCKQQGAKKIAIGEGPSYFQPASDLRACFTATGIADIAARQAVPWILFDDGPFRRFRKHSPRLPDQFCISEHAFSWDHIINVPVPKTHYLTTVSIAMKNLKGFIKREDKPSFHYCGTHHIHGSVTQLNIMIRPSLNIVDCTAPVHKNRGFVLAGTDIVAVDAVAASLMGLNPSTIETIRLGHEAGLGEMDLSRIDIIGDDVQDLVMNFEQPRQFLRRAFPLLQLSAKNACSGCLIPLFSALRKIEEKGISVKSETLLILGKQDAPPSGSMAVCIGECTKKFSAGSWLAGCPPTKEELFAFLNAEIQRLPCINNTLR